MVEKGEVSSRHSSEERDYATYEEKTAINDLINQDEYDATQQ